MAYSTPELLKLHYRENGFTGVARKVVEHCFFRRPRIAPELYWRIAPRYYAALASNDAEPYVAPLDPFKRIAVDPDQITVVTGREHPPWRNRLKKFGAVRDGTWDQQRIEADTNDPQDLLRFEDLDEYLALRHRFVDGCDWRSIPFVRERIERVERGESVWHQCTSREDVFERCRQIDELYESIVADGYLSQEEILKEKETNLGFPDLLDEVTVDIGRDGRLLFVDGKHRLSIAKILDLASIPVVVHVRHAEWMQRRDQACTRGDQSNHPDLWEFNADTVHSSVSEIGRSVDR